MRTHERISQEHEKMTARYLGRTVYNDIRHFYHLKLGQLDIPAFINASYPNLEEIHICSTFYDYNVLARCTQISWLVIPPTCDLFKV